MGLKVLKEGKCFSSFMFVRKSNQQWTILVHKIVYQRVHKEYLK